MKISEILKTKRTVSFEFFPPKKVENEEVLFSTIKSLSSYNPDFVSVTYGAGGSTRDKTLEWVRAIKQDYNLEVMMHLTCIGATKTSITEITEKLKNYGIDNILALRGDLPEDEEMSEIVKDFKYASDLVPFLKSKGDFSVGVAGYPEKHLECTSFEKDIEHLKMKIDAGGDVIFTQLFFDNEYFLRYVDAVRKAGIDAPIIPGIMPITNASQVMRFTSMCGVHVPEWITKEMDGKSADDMAEIGIEYAVKMCGELWNSGAAGLHFYTLNKSDATEQILKRLSL